MLFWNAQLHWSCTRPTHEKNITETMKLWWIVHGHLGMAWNRCMTTKEDVQLFAWEGGDKYHTFWLHSWSLDSLWTITTKPTEPPSTPTNDTCSDRSTHHVSSPTKEPDKEADIEGGKERYARYVNIAIDKALPLYAPPAAPMFTSNFATGLVY